MNPHSDRCTLCQEDGGRVIWRDASLRIIAVAGDAHPGFTRVVWNEHISEMTQLPSQARDSLMAAVWRVEQIQRSVLRPDKINLAQFGNMTPHLHWHVIPRWADDSHFPEAIWAAAPARSHAQAMAWNQHKTRMAKRLPDYWAALHECCKTAT